jgi:hypothetical protein
MKKKRRVRGAHHFWRTGDEEDQQSLGKASP